MYLFGIMLSLNEFIANYQTLLEISKENLPQIELSRLCNLYNAVKLNGGWYETISRNNWHEISDEDDAWMLFETTSLVKLEALLNYTASVVDQESINSQDLTAEISDSVDCIISTELPEHTTGNERSANKKKQRKRHKSMRSIKKITWRSIAPIIFPERK